jgi:hypothetical protein
MKDWYKKRQEYTHENLPNDIRFSEPNDFKNFLSLDSTSFGELLKLVTPEIEKSLSGNKLEGMSIKVIRLDYWKLIVSFSAYHLYFTCELGPFLVSRRGEAWTR